jgi:glutamine amidotransferase
MIGIIDYKLGNMASVIGACKFLNVDFIISSNPKDLINCSHLILGGVGAFPDGKKNLDDLSLTDFIIDASSRGVYLLGICLGFQMLGNYSMEFNQTKGLGLIDAEIVKLKNDRLPIPHVGWNNINIDVNSKIFKNIDQNELFYFVHSFHMKCKNIKDVCATVVYGDKIVAAINHENIYGVQFHPEKSQRAGLMLLQNFTNLK